MDSVVQNVNDRIQSLQSKLQSVAEPLRDTLEATVGRARELSDEGIAIGDDYLAALAQVEAALDETDQDSPDLGVVADAIVVTLDGITFGIDETLRVTEPVFDVLEAGARGFASAVEELQRLQETLQDIFNFSAQIATPLNLIRDALEPVDWALNAAQDIFESVVGPVLNPILEATGIAGLLEDFAQIFEPILGRLLDLQSGLFDIEINLGIVDGKFGFFEDLAAAWENLGPSLGLNTNILNPLPKVSDFFDLSEFPELADLADLPAVPEFGVFRDLINLPEFQFSFGDVDAPQIIWLGVRNIGNTAQEAIEEALEEESLDPLTANIAIFSSNTLLLPGVQSGNDIFVVTRGNDILDLGTGDDDQDVATFIGSLSDFIITDPLAPNSPDDIDDLSQELSLIGSPSLVDAGSLIVSRGRDEENADQGFDLILNAEVLHFTDDGLGLVGTDEVRNFPYTNVNGNGDSIQGTDNITGREFLIGDAGNNELFGNGGDDVLLGAEGDDTIGGGTGNNLLLGGAGDDLLFFTSESDLLDGGEGFDILDLDVGFEVAPRGEDDVALAENPLGALLLSIGALPQALVDNIDLDAVQTNLENGRLATANSVTEGEEDLGSVVDLDTQNIIRYVTTLGTSNRTGLEQDITVANIEGITGTEFRDNLSGSSQTADLSGDNFLDGRGGDDTIDGRSGDDVLVGGNGSDIILGGAGDDTLVANGSINRDPDATDTLTGGEGADTFSIDGQGLAIITDFELGLAKLDVRPAGAAFSDLEFEPVDPAGTNVLLNGAVIPTLEGVAPGDITAADVLVAAQAEDDVVTVDLSVGGSITTLLDNDLIGSDAATSDLNIVAINGIPVDPGDSIVLASGVHLRLEADGSLSAEDPFGVLADRTTPPETAEQFTYTVEDDSGSRSEATVSLSIFDSSFALTTAPETARTGEDYRVTISPLVNDIGVGLVITAATVAVGTIEIAENGTDLIYTPAPDFSGEVTVSYTVTDILGATSSSDVTVTVVPAVDGTDDNDALDGDEGSNVSNGFAGHDRLWGREGDDTLSGGDDDDTLFSGDGDDLALGGAGHDRVAGGFGNDTLEGGSGDDTLLGSQGNDLILGGTGSDTLFGGRDADTLEGGSDDDELFAGSGDDNASGGAGNDLLIGGDGADTLSGGTGQDTLSGSKGTDTLDGGAGNDVLRGGAENDSLTGDSGNDRLFGGTGNDTIIGQGDNDRIVGRDGDDILYGDLQDDPSAGVLGADTFVFDLNDGNDQVFDFASGVDQVQLLGNEVFSLDVTDAGDSIIEFGATTIVFLNATVTETDIVQIL